MYSLDVIKIQKEVNERKFGSSFAKKKKK
jgi:hypothetical protein